MVTQTKNYGLTKDDENEFYNVLRVNANLDKIDEEIKKIDDKTGDISQIEEKSLVEAIKNDRTQLSDYTKLVPYGGATTGTANTYAIATPTITELKEGMAVTVKINIANTGSSTLNWCGLGVKTIKKANGSTLSSGNLKTGGVYTLRYDGTSFILQGEGGEYGTATENQVLNTHTIGTETGIKQGKIPIKTSQTYTPTTSDQTITSGQYLSGVQTIKGDANFVASNINYGVSMWGLTGTGNKYKIGDTLEREKYVKYLRNIGGTSNYYALNNGGIGFQISDYLYCEKTSELYINDNNTLRKVNWSSDIPSIIASLSGVSITRCKVRNNVLMGINHNAGYIKIVPTTLASAETFTVDANYRFRDIEFDDNFIYAIEYTTQSLYKYDRITKQLVYSLKLNGNPHEMAIMNNILYITTSTGIWSLPISNIASGEKYSMTLDNDNFSNRRLFVRNNKIYVGYASNITIFSDGLTYPTTISSFNNNTVNYLAVDKGDNIYDISSSISYKNAITGTWIGLSNSSYTKMILADCGVLFTQFNYLPYKLEIISETDSIKLI